jgi:tight adherence protein B
MMLAVSFVLALLLSFALLAAVLRPGKSEDSVRRRVTQVATRTHAEGKEDEGMLKAEATGAFPLLERTLERFGMASRIRKLILESGSPWTVGRFGAFSLFAAVAAGLLLEVLGPGWPMALAAGAAAGCVPAMLLRHQRARRLKVFDAALPDAIDLMARALRAGHSLNSAIECVAEQAAEPVAVEFADVFRQQNFGLPLRDCLLAMATRMPSNDLHFLVTAMLVQKETGGNLVEILDRTNRVIRERLRIQGEVRTRTAQGRMTGWILSLLPVVMLLLLNLINPGYSRVLMESALGRKLLYAGLGLISVGAFLIRRIVDVQV